MRSEELLALAAIAPDTLARFPVDEILAARLSRPLENNLLIRRVPVRDDGRVVGTLLEDGSTLLAALFPLGIGPLGRHAGALLAARMLALEAFLGDSERRVADMAFTMHTHFDGLLDTQDMTLGRVPLAGLELDTIELAELLRTLSKNLRSRDLFGLGRSAVFLLGFDRNSFPAARVSHQKHGMTDQTTGG